MVNFSDFMGDVLEWWKFGENSRIETNILLFLQAENWRTSAYIIV
jgi:hypothetical protein